VLAAAEAFDPERDQHRAERGVGGQVDDRDGEQRPRGRLAEQHPRPLGEIAGDGTEALGLRLVITLEAGEEDSPAAGAPGIPASLVRLGRTPRFRRAVAVMAAALDTEADELAARLVAALAATGAAVGRDLAEADWWRLLDALTLVAAHPAERPGGA
jgi:hypothetical protein